MTLPQLFCAAGFALAGIDGVFVGRSVCLPPYTDSVTVGIVVSAASRYVRVPVTQVIKPRTRPKAGDAATTSILEPKVLPGVGVARRAMGGSRAACGDRIRAENVFAVARRADVVGVATSPRTVVASEVVQWHSIGDRADFALVSDAVDKADLTLIPVPSDAIPLNAGPLPNVATALVGDPPGPSLRSAPRIVEGHKLIHENNLTLSGSRVQHRRNT